MKTPSPTPRLQMQQKEEAYEKRKKIIHQRKKQTRPLKTGVNINVYT